MKEWFPAPRLFFFQKRERSRLAFGTESEKRFGTLSVGNFSLGALAISSGSCYFVRRLQFRLAFAISFDVLAIGRSFAYGGHARAAAAIGKTEAVGRAFAATAVAEENRAEFAGRLCEIAPEILNWARRLAERLA